MAVSGPGELRLAAGAFGALALLLLPVSIAAERRVETRGRPSMSATVD
jgi:hypothetical protein